MKYIQYMKNGLFLFSLLLLLHVFIVGQVFSQETNDATENTAETPAESDTNEVTEEAEDLITISLKESDILEYALETQYVDGDGVLYGLQGAVNIEIDNNNTMYVVGNARNALSMFRFDEEQNTLIELNTVEFGRNREILGVWDLAITQDSKFMYVTGNKSHSVSVFGISDDYSLTNLYNYTDGINGVNGLRGAREIIITQDDKYVLVVSEEDSSLLIFQRNLNSGLLTLLAQYKDGVGTIEGIGGARGIAMNKEETKVYVVGYKDAALVEFDRNLGSGRLQLVATHRSGENDIENLGGVSTVAVSDDGQHVFVASFTDNAIAVFSYNQKGQLVFVQSLKNGQNNVNGLKNAYKIVVSKENNLYVSAYGGSSLSEYSFKEGVLTQTAVFSNGVGGIQGLSGAWGVNIDDKGRVFVTGFKDNAISWFSPNLVTNLMSYQATLYDTTNKIEGLRGVWGVTMSPDEKFLYSFGVSHNTISIFRVNEGAGQPFLYVRSVDLQSAIAQNSTQERIDQNIQGIWNITISQDGQSMYATNYEHDAVIFLTRNPENGDIEFKQMYQNGIDIINGLQGAYDIVVSQDQTRVFVTGYSSDSLVIFSRESDGSLQMQEALTNSINNIQGLDGAYNIAESKDGNSLYVTGRIDNTLVWFQKEGEGFVFKEYYKNGRDGIIGLGNAAGVSVHPNGHKVYASGRGDGALAIFDRNEEGELSLRTTIFEIEEQVPLTNISEIRIGGKEHNILVANVERKIVFFGLGENGFPVTFKYIDEGDETPWDFAVSNIDGRVFASGYFPNTLAIFSKDIVVAPTEGEDSSEEGNTNPEE